MQYNMNTNFNDVGRKDKRAFRSDLRSLSPSQGLKRSESPMDKIVKYKKEVLEKYKNKNEEMEQAMQFAQNLSNPKNRFNQTFGDPFMNNSINNPNS